MNIMRDVERNMYIICLILFDTIKEIFKVKFKEGKGEC